MKGGLLSGDPTAKDKAKPESLCRLTDVADPFKVPIALQPAEQDASRAEEQFGLPAEQHAVRLSASRSHVPLNLE